MGIALSTKSACREGEESISHAVAALGLDPARAARTLRFSLGKDTSESDIRCVAAAFAKIFA
jgi:cysteine desulfurase